MQRNVEFKDFEPSKHFTSLIDRLTAKLEKNIGTFSPDAVHLRLMVEHNSARKLYTFSLTLDVPGKTLAAKEERHDIQAGIRSVFEEIDRQLKKYKANLRREHWKRPERRQELREMKAEAASSVTEEGKREAFFSMVTPHLKRVDHFVRHLIQYSEAMGDLPKGNVSPSEIVDGALLRAYREFASGRSIPDVKNWLVRDALDQLDSVVTRLKAERETTVQIEEERAA